MRTDQKERTEDAGIAVVGMRVVEIGSRVALGYCGEPFADFDTEVLKAASGEAPPQSFQMVKARRA